MDDEDFQSYEDSIGLNHVESIKADVFVGSLKDMMLRMGLSIYNCRAQCYDGAVNVRCKEWNFYPNL